MHVLVKSAVLLHSEHVGQVRVLHHWHQTFTVAAIGAWP